MPKRRRTKPFRVDEAKLRTIGRDLLRALGEDIDTPRLVDTPARWARMWREFVERDPGSMDTAFTHERPGDQMVVVSGMRVWSFCEHHLLPFWCDIAIGYIPDSRVLGLSKFGRIAHHRASRLQIQERLVREIAEAVKEAAACEHVAVLAVGEHLCMTMRGIKTPARMTSSVMDGRFREVAVRSEFLSLARTV